MVGFSAYAWQENQPFFVYWGRRTLKPLTPGEVAASADGEGVFTRKSREKSMIHAKKR